jgi:hypothetical protein
MCAVRQDAMAAIVVARMNSSETGVWTQELLAASLAPEDAIEQRRLYWPGIVQAAVAERGAAVVRVFGPPDFGAVYVDTFLRK